MSRIEDIANELLVVDSEISTYDARLQREEGEISNTMNKAHSAFGDQKAGQQLVSSLYKAMQGMILADGSLQGVKAKIHNYIHKLQK